MEYGDVDVFTIDNYMVTANRKYAATLIARFMEDRLTDVQAHELDEWLFANDDNMQLFELLTEEHNTDWAKKWFADAGVENKYLLHKNYDGWYKPQTKPAVSRGMIVSLLAAAAVVVLFFLVNELTRSPEPVSFVFREKTIEQISDQLEARYNIQVHYSGQSELLFSAEIPKSYSLMQTLDTLQKICGITVNIKNKQVFISDH